MPDLTGAQHLYGGGRVAEIEDIARHGIRSADKRGLRLASMPAFGSLPPYKGEPLPSLTPGQIEDVTQYVLALNGSATDPDAAAKGGILYQNGAGCYDCHGRNAEGDSSVGAPSLVDGPRLYGDGSHDDIYRSLVAGRAGVSPALQAADRSRATQRGRLHRLVPEGPHRTRGCPMTDLAVQAPAAKGHSAA